MLYQRSSGIHHRWISSEPLRGSLKHVLMHPAADTPIIACGALRGFYPDIADASEKVDNDRRGVS